jgi:multiple sugar transport system substrate-binding protein
MPRAAELHPEDRHLHLRPRRRAHGPGAVHLLAGTRRDDLRNGFLEPLDKYIDLNGLEDWAHASWMHNGQVYGLLLEAYSIELYYNRGRVRQLGVEVPANGQLTQAQFTDLVRRGAAAGITPLAEDAADRPYRGADLLEEALLRRLGPDDYKKLLTGRLPFGNPRVIEVMTWVRQLVDLGAWGGGRSVTRARPPGQR